METFEITDEMFGREELTAADVAMFMEPVGYEAGESVGPKFSSVAAWALWRWSLDSGQDETSGESQYGNGWHALFRDERAVLHENDQAFVNAWRVPEGKDIETEWSQIEAGAVYEDDCDCGEC